MKRTIITMDGNGTLSIPSNLENLWMGEGELVNIFHATAPKLNSVIRAIYKGRYAIYVRSSTQGQNFRWRLANAV